MQTEGLTTGQIWMSFRPYQRQSGFHHSLAGNLGQLLCLFPCLLEKNKNDVFLGEGF